MYLSICVELYQKLPQECTPTELHRVSYVAALRTLEAEDIKNPKGSEDKQI